jgi:hypothetical protein
MSPYLVILEGLFVIVEMDREVVPILGAGDALLGDVRGQLPSISVRRMPRGSHPMSKRHELTSVAPLREGT